MEIQSIDRRETFFHNDFLEEYYFGDKLDKFRSYKSYLREIPNAIKAKSSFPMEIRVALKKALHNQYKKSGITVAEFSVLNQNINDLVKENTFTVTTGQQIHIGLGPHYVLYKILDVLAICKQAKNANPDYNFIPVFWMASEDHDLEEVKDVVLFKKRFTWNTDQQGAVGRMKTKGITKLFEEISETFNLTPDLEFFLDACVEAYSLSNFSDAFRKLLHTFFNQTGLLVLDGDDESLKHYFKVVAEDEMLQKNDAILKETTSQLGKVGFEKQLNTRKTNLFYLTDNGRDRIENLSGVLQTHKGRELCSKEKIEQFLEDNIKNISPNAALRPLYQELILPNLVYVGGPSEVKYWMQLKGLFNNYSLPVPIIHLRTSNIIVPQSKIKQLSLDKIEVLFRPDDKLLDIYASELAGKKEEFACAINNILEILKSYSAEFEAFFTGSNISGKVKKVKDKIIDIQSFTDVEMIKKSQSHQGLEKLLKIKNMFFNPSNIQERNEHIISISWLLKEDMNSLLPCFGLKGTPEINILLS